MTLHMPRWPYKHPNTQTPITPNAQTPKRSNPQTPKARPDWRTLTGMRRAALAGITALVTATSATSFAESYRALYLWAGHHGLAGLWVAVWPLQVDTFIAVGELTLVIALADAWSFRSRIAAWLVTLAGLAESVVGNVGHVQGHDLASRATAAVPPLAAAAALAVGLGVLKRLVDHATVPVPADAPTPPALDPDELAALDSGAKRARLAAAVLGTSSPAAVTAALADVGYPMATEAVRSALRNPPKPDIRLAPEVA